MIETLGQQESRKDLALQQMREDQQLMTLDEMHKARKQMKKMRKMLKKVYKHQEEEELLQLLQSRSRPKKHKKHHSSDFDADYAADLLRYLKRSRKK